MDSPSPLLRVSVEFFLKRSNIVSASKAWSIPVLAIIKRPVSNVRVIFPFSILCRIAFRKRLLINSSVNILFAFRLIIFLNVVSIVSFFAICLLGKIGNYFTHNIVNRKRRKLRKLVVLNFCQQQKIFINPCKPGN